MKDPVPHDLVGSAYIATQVQGRATVLGKPLTLQFAADGMLISMSGGCNALSGTPLFDDNRLTVPQIISTKMACVQDGVMEQESWYSGWLSSGVTWKLEGKTLMLTGGGVTVTFVRSGAAGQGGGSTSVTSAGMTDASPGPVVSPQSPLPEVSHPIRPTMGGDTPMPPPTR